ncbi:hypothetical protein ACFT8P_13435 [Streptomyces sp. NPDC057101]|uniref:hypothetical protein n=1 Tax=Streptomyces sp. NPDC057101 TaxID=3346020 RepID=UPI00363D8E03
MLPRKQQDGKPPMTTVSVPPPPRVPTVGARAAVTAARGLSVYNKAAGKAAEVLLSHDRDLEEISEDDMPQRSKGSAAEGQRRKAVRILKEIAATAPFTCAGVALGAVEPLFEALGDVVAGQIGDHYEREAWTLLEAFPTEVSLWDLAYVESKEFWKRQPGMAGMAGSGMSAEGRYAVLLDRLHTMLRDPQIRAAYEQALTQHQREEAEASTAADGRLKEQLSVIVQTIAAQADNRAPDGPPEHLAVWARPDGEISLFPPIGYDTGELTTFMHLDTDSTLYLLTQRTSDGLCEWFSHVRVSDLGLIDWDHATPC